AGARFDAKQMSDSLEDAIAGGVAEGVVVPLEAADIDQADGTPAAALFEGEKRFELFDEASEIHERRLRITVRAIGEVGDQLFEITRDAADGGVLGGQLVSRARHLFRETGGEGLNRFLF